VADRLERLASVSLQLHSAVVLGWLPHAGPVARDEDNSLATSRRLNTNGALLHEAVVAQRVAPL